MFGLQLSEIAITLLIVAVFGALIYVAVKLGRR
jgi:hypothetical protein